MVSKEHSGPKSYQYPVILLLACLSGFVIPALESMFMDAGVRTTIGLHGSAPGAVWVLLSCISAAWGGFLVFCTLRFSFRQCLPVLLFPVLANALWDIMFVVIEPAAQNAGMVVALALLYNAVCLLGWLLAVGGFGAAVRRKSGRARPHEVLMAALVLLTLEAVGFAARAVLAVAEYFSQSGVAARALSNVRRSPAQELLGWLPGWCRQEAANAAVAFAAYLALYLVCERREEFCRFVSRFFAGARPEPGAGAVLKAEGGAEKR